MSLDLAARYQELQEVERDLSRVEQQLMAAHLKLSGPSGPRPETLYTEVLNLRQKTRWLLGRLGDDLVAG
jgi:hypothetical protein